MAVFFRSALFVPLVFALIGLVVPDNVFFVLFKISTGLMMAAGIPYACFVVCALVWSFYHAGKNFTLAYFWSPFVFSLFCFIYFFIIIGPNLEIATLLASMAFASIAMMVSSVYCLACFGMQQFFMRRLL